MGSYSFISIPNPNINEDIMRLYKYTNNVNSTAWVNLDSVTQIDSVTGASSGNGLILTLTNGEVTISLAAEITEVATILGITPS
jgi:hypothetical protein